jgi:hypothetical protein
MHVTTPSLQSPPAFGHLFACRHLLACRHLFAITTQGGQSLAPPVPVSASTTGLVHYRHEPTTYLLRFTSMKLAYSQLHHECAHSCAPNLILTSVDVIFLCCPARVTRAGSNSWCSDDVSLGSRSLPRCLAYCCRGTTTHRILVLVPTTTNHSARLASGSYP